MIKIFQQIKDTMQTQVNNKQDQNQIDYLLDNKVNRIHYFKIKCLLVNLHLNMFQVLIRLKLMVIIYLLALLVKMHGKNVKNNFKEIEK